MKRKPWRIPALLILALFIGVCATQAEEAAPSFSLSVPSGVKTGQTFTVSVSSGTPFQRAQVTISNGSARYSRSYQPGSATRAALDFGPFTYSGPYDVYCEVDFPMDAGVVTVSQARTMTVNVGDADSASSGLTTDPDLGWISSMHVNTQSLASVSAMMITPTPVPSAGRVQMIVSQRTLRPGVPIQVEVSAAGASRIELYLNGQELREFRSTSGQYSLTYEMARAKTSVGQASLYALAYYAGGTADTSFTVTIDDASFAASPAPTAAPAPATAAPFDPQNAPVQQVSATAAVSLENCSHGLGWRYLPLPGSSTYDVCPNDNSRHYMTSRWVQPVCGLCGKAVGEAIQETFASPEESMAVERHYMGSDGRCIFCDAMVDLERLTGSVEDGADLYLPLDDTEEYYVCGADPREPCWLGFYGSAGFDPKARSQYVQLMLRNGREAVADSPAFMDFLWHIRQRGFGYAAMTNVVFECFLGREAEFESIFGYPMRDEAGRYNYHLMLVDIASLTDDGWDENLAVHSMGFFQTLDRFLLAHGMQSEHSLDLGVIPERTASQSVVVFLPDQRLWYLETPAPEIQSNGQHWVTVTGTERLGGQSMMTASVLGQKAYMNLANADLVEERAFACRISIMR